MERHSDAYEPNSIYLYRIGVETELPDTHNLDKYNQKYLHNQIPHQVRMVFLLLHSAQTHLLLPWSLKGQYVVLEKDFYINNINKVKIQTWKYLVHRSLFEVRKVAGSSKH